MDREAIKNKLIEYFHLNHYSEEALEDFVEGWLDVHRWMESELIRREVAPRFQEERATAPFLKWSDLRALSEDGVVDVGLPEKERKVP